MYHLVSGKSPFSVVTQNPNSKKLTTFSKMYNKSWCIDKGNSINWKLFQILFILQNCLIFQTTCHHYQTSVNGHGLIRSSSNEIFIPRDTPSSTSLPVDEVEVGGAATITEKTIDKINSKDMSMPSEDVVENKNIEDVETIPTVNAEPPEPEEEDEDDLEEDTNKAKRSKGYLKRLLRRLGLSSASQEPFREREFEAQMADDSNDATPTTAKPSSFLSKLNPINKISYKINTAKSVVNRALNVVGLGSKPAGSGGSDGGAGAGDEGPGGEEGSTREGGDESADSGVGSVFWSGQQLFGGLLAIGVILMGR